MGALLFFRTRKMIEMTIDEKWEIVKAHYEAAYRVKFRGRLADEKIEELFQKLQVLQRTERILSTQRMAEALKSQS